MCKIIFRIIIVLITTILLYSTSYAQASDPETIKQSFIQTINLELKSLQEWGLLSKNQPERTLVYRQVPDYLKRSHQSFKRLGVKNQKDDNLFEDKYKAFYSEWDKNFTYDIKKTDSLVSPCIGVVKFYGKQYYKEGKTKEECLSSPWRVETSNVDGRPLIYEPTLIYSYQNGKWTLKEAPPAYKKY